ncbi:hypothetical protein T01_11164 [Trichinella spiralis]|uniref:Uncharacterized protein n=1 Tax=Trichinella spiralis TaxID=6334 RepID=A0A0V1AN12_TRISP|nr:hypothetical protein T01_11164 [Trichinella spiralis]
MDFDFECSFSLFCEYLMEYAVTLYPEMFKLIRG